MILLRSSANGVIVPVHVQPRASKDRLVGEHGGALKVAVTAPPEGGRANDAVAKLIATSLGIATSRVTLASGQTSRAKSFLIGLSIEDALPRFKASLPHTDFGAEPIRERGKPTM